MKKYLVFCDESCHLIDDKSDYMVISSIKCLKDNYAQIKNDIRNIKKKFGFGFKEIKWSRLSLKYVDFYKAIVDYFFESEDMLCTFVILLGKNEVAKVLPNKSIFDDAYYRCYGILMHNIINTFSGEYQFYLDIKDTRGKEKTRCLLESIKETLNPHGGNDIKCIEIVDSQCNDLIQMSDFFAGFLSYNLRKMYLEKNSDRCKTEIHNYIFNKINNVNSKVNNKFSFIRVKYKND